METGSKDTLSWLHGLEDFFKFTDNYEEEEYARLFLNLNYADDPFFPLKKLLTLAHKLDLTEEEYNRTISLFLNSFKAISTDIDSELDLVEWNKVAMTVFPDNELFSILHKYFRSDNNSLDSISDAFSRGQVQSKIWLINELQKVDTHFDTIYHLGGWFGQLTWYLNNHVTFNKYRNFDIDVEACKVSDYIVNLRQLENYKVKSVELGLPLWDDSDDKRNMSWITRTGCEYEIKNYSNDNTFKEKTQPDLIINTSAEHMPSIWFDKFVNRPQSTDPLYVIQTNNLFDADGHVNCVHSVDHLIKKFNMNRIEYAGELQLKGYKRFMLIGRP
jgi:hypothetical protein